jgi:tRNA (adenine37-N6)-methyltransferase
VIEFNPVGYVTTSYADPSGAPHQASANADAVGQVVLREELVPALLGLAGYPYIWLLTWLHIQPEPGDLPLQLVPRAKEATGEVQGVFASRAPERPNPIGLSLVRQLGVEGNVIRFGGVDLVDGTPVVDIKPWFADCDLPADLGDGVDHSGM